MSIIINKPTDWIQSSVRKGDGWHTDVSQLYDRLEVLTKEFKTDRNINLRYHSKESNCWHIKKGYVPGYFYFDKYGYAGWSELAKSYTEPDITMKEVLETIDICNYFIDNNISKAPQPFHTDIPEKPYILVTGQLITDTVSKLAYIKCNELPKLIRKVYKDTKYNVVFKPHPLDKSSEGVSGSIHELIKHSEAVFTVNSGTGFEALMQGKRVFTAGDCEYKWVTTELRNEQDIIDSIELVEKPPQYGKMIRFLHHCFNEHFVDAYDDNSIRRKLSRVVNE